MSMIIAVILAAMVVVASSMSLPSDNDVQQLDSAGEQELENARRATWLETRELKAAFKEMVLNALTELTEEGLVAEGVVANSPEPKEKRGRWQGFCFKRTRNGRFLPYICWKGDRK